MKRTIELAPELVLGTDSVTDRIALISRSGEGKTFRGLKLYEEMYDAGAQCVWLDPVGKGWALRLAADGKSPGLDVFVFGGLHGDLPLEPTAGALIARVIVERGISAVIDVSIFEDRDMKRFVTDFARELYRLKQRDDSVMHLFVEEASTFMPQDKEDGNDPPMLAAMKKLARKGRNYGVGFTMIDQRPQDVNKKCLNQAEMLIVLGTSGTAERKAIEAWIRDKHIDASGLDELASLEQGEAFVWIPRKKIFLKVGKVTRKTYDASATPKLGVKRTERKLTPLDVTALGEAIAASAERAAANDPEVLRKRIADLERQVAERPATSLAAPERVEVLVLHPADIVRLEKATAVLEARGGHLVQAQQAVVLELGGVRAALDRLHHKTEAAVQHLHPSQPPTPKPTARGKSANGSDTVSLGKGEREILVALALRDAPIAREHLGVMTGYKHSSGTFHTYLSSLCSRGLIQRDRQLFSITAAGLDLIGPVQTPRSRSDWLDLWCARLTGKPREMLRAIAAHPVTKEQLAEMFAMAPGSGTFSTYLSTLRANGLIERHGDEYRLSENAP